MYVDPHPLKDFHGVRGERRHRRHTAPADDATDLTLQRFAVPLDRDRLARVHELLPLGPVLGMCSVQQLPHHRLAAPFTTPYVRPWHQHAAVQVRQRVPQAWIGQHPVGLKAFDQGQARRFRICEPLGRRVARAGFGLHRSPPATAGRWAAGAQPSSVYAVPARMPSIAARV